MKKLTPLFETRLELSFFSGPGVTVLLGLESLLLASDGSLLPFFGEGGGFGGQGFLDALLNGVDGGSGEILAILGLDVTSVDRGSVETTLADGISQIWRRFWVGDLAGDEGVDGVLEELVGEIAATTDVVHELLVGGAEVGGEAGLHRSEVMSLGLALSPAAGGAGGDPEHSFVDEIDQGFLPQSGEGGELHGLGNALEPLHGTVGEESILGVRGRHGEREIQMFSVNKRIKPDFVVSLL